ncbi:VOC family protein [Pedobacter sp. AW31-3R]|uniref:VOC family protein n=1 Tax=Pedobacter sp. AW31-3R TaxID=3445781 RepID=UPI003FA04779
MMKSISTLLTVCMVCLSFSQSQAQASITSESAKLNHIAVYVNDLNKSGAFYQSLLQLVKIDEPFKDGKHIWFTLGSAGQMHLIQGPHHQRIKYNKNEHLCFSVTSIVDFITRLDQQKIEYVNWEGTAKAPTVRIDGVKQIYFQDPDGHWLEVNDAR